MKKSLRSSGLSPGHSCLQKRGTKGRPIAKSQSLYDRMVWIDTETEIERFVRDRNATLKEQ